jgi:intracellular multiplication protein IcmV
MKKKSDRRVIRVFKAIFAFGTWFDAARAKLFSTFVRDGYKKTFSAEELKPNVKDALTESFLAAQKQMKLTEEDIILRQNSLYKLSVLMSCCAFIIFAYFVYNLICGTFLAAAISLFVMTIPIALAFRYHFWYFQFKSRRLGCSAREWFKLGLLGESK